MIRPVMFRGLVLRAVEFQFGQGLLRGSWDLVSRVISSLLRL